jgi:hypothetical protein
MVVCLTSLLETILLEAKWSMTPLYNIQDFLFITHNDKLPISCRCLAYPKHDAATTTLENTEESTTLHSLDITGLYDKVKRRKPVLKNALHIICFVATWPLSNSEK